MLRKIEHRKHKKICRTVSLILLTILTVNLTAAYKPVQIYAAEQDLSLSDGDTEEPSEEMDTPADTKVTEKVETVVPIYNYGITNVVAPAKFAVALNPYQMEVRINDTEISTDQIVSKKYGIINKSSTDQIVTVTLTVEDLNEGKIVFVDSMEKAQNADPDTYAVYLAAVPADESGIKVGGENVNQNTSASDLSDVDMTGVLEKAVAMKEGDNSFSFKLSRAVYSFEDGSGLSLDDGEKENRENLKLSSLAPGGGGVTAFTFAGAMNPRADWGKLVNGVRISAVYTYKTASGDERIIEGTGGMIEVE